MELIISLIILGFISLSSQVIIIRELLILNYGNELSIGIILAVWLLCYGAGSLSGILLLKNSGNGGISKSAGIFRILQIILFFMLPLTIVACRVLPKIFNLVPGEIVNPGFTILSGFIIIFPVTFLLGMLFILAIDIYANNIDNKIPSGYVYMYESIGAVLGGVFTNIFFIKLNPLLVMFLLGLLLVISVKSKVMKILFLFISIGLIYYTGYFSRNLANFQWAPYRVLKSENSVYQNIILAEKGGQISVFTNGLLAFTVNDRLSNEFNAHVPMAEHPLPKDVLLIGNGVSGIIPELLKHNPESIDYVEQDINIIKLTQAFVNKELTGIPDKKVNIEIGDVRLFLKNTGKKYDIVIINFCDPRTILINRLYTLEFFRQVNARLNKNGILSFSFSSNPNYISTEQRRFYQTIYNTLAGIFPEVIITPGEKNSFAACRDSGVLTKDWKLMVSRLNSRKVKPEHFNERYLFADFSAERFEYYNDIVAGENNLPVNSDFKPVAFYYNIILWTTYCNGTVTKIFKVFSSPVLFGLSVAGLVFIFFFCRKSRLKQKIAIVVTMSGFFQMAVQVLAVVIFQILYGYVFYKISVIFTAFMLGLVIGAYYANKKIESDKYNYDNFVNSQVLFAVFTVILTGLVFLMHKTGGAVLYALGSSFIIPVLLPAVCGIAGGYQYSIGNKLYVDTEKHYAAGKLYALDLFGSAASGILVSMLFIPVLGIYPTLFCLFLLSFTGLIILKTK